MKAKKKQLEVFKPADLGVEVKNHLKTLKVTEPPKRSAGIKVPDVATLVAQAEERSQGHLDPTEKPDILNAEDAKDSQRTQRNPKEDSEFLCGLCVILRPLRSKIIGAPTMSSLVIAEHDNASIKPATLNTVTAAAKCGGEVHVLVAGYNAGAAAAAAAQIAGVTRSSTPTPSTWPTAWPRTWPRRCSPSPAPAPTATSCSRPPPAARTSLRGWPPSWTSARSRM